MRYRILNYADGSFRVQRKRLFWRMARCSGDTVCWTDQEYGPRITKFDTKTEAEAIITADVIECIKMKLGKQIINIEEFS